MNAGLCHYCGEMTTQVAHLRYRHECEKCTVPCEFCGDYTLAIALRKCSRCWEAENRLEDLLRTPKGRQLVIRYDRAVSDPECGWCAEPEDREYE